MDIKDEFKTLHDNHPNMGTIALEMLHHQLKMYDAVLGIDTFSNGYIPGDTFNRFKVWSELYGA